MIKDIRLHGFVTDTSERYEYFTTVIGPALNVRFFYEQDEDVQGTRDRFFLSGNEISLYQHHLYHRGNGGTFCNYMIGMEQPVKDVLKPEVQNRLVMYGAHYGEAGERIIFTNDTSGSESYERVFSEGHAFANYYFFIAGDIQGDLKVIQETVLRLTGKFLKRSQLDTDQDSNIVAAQLYREIGIPRWTLFVVKLIDRYALDYYTKFAEIYRAGHWRNAAEREGLVTLAMQYGFEPTVRERLELDVIYKHPENRQLIESYRDILTARYLGRQEERVTQFKRKRLRTLGARRHLPPLLFDKLDRLLRPRQTEMESPACLVEARRRFNELFMDRQAGPRFTEQDLWQLLQARLEALQQHYNGFEELMTELEQSCLLRQDSDPTALELFRTVAGHLDRFEASYEIVSSVAFIDDYELREEQLYLLVRAKDVIDTIQMGLFDQLIFQTVGRHHYLNLYGRKRLHRLKEGVEAIVALAQQPATVIGSIAEVNYQLRLRRAVEVQLRDRVRDVYKEPIGKQEQEFLRIEISRKLIQEGIVSDLIPADLFA
ncbi:MAG: TIGR04442 family protein, partial [Acidobacteriota bacterium]